MCRQDDVSQCYAHITVKQYSLGYIMVLYFCGYLLVYVNFYLSL